jgi:sigma-B regulation protein RsbU (phosphoserine phosphatase)
MQGTAREIALDIVTKDGRRVPVLVNSVLDRDSRSRPRTVRTAVFDATQRREYERELLLSKTRAEESEARARALAQTLQQTLIPPTPPAIPGLEVAARYRPAGDGSEVGGDFYDVFQVGPDDWVVTIGDVSGKGVDAAVVTALVRYTLRAAAVANDAPSDALGVLNTVLLRHDTERFCTVAFLRVRQQGEQVTCTLAAAGHPLPLLRHADGGTGLAGLGHGAARPSGARRAAGEGAGTRCARHPRRRRAALRRLTQPATPTTTTAMSSRVVPPWKSTTSSTTAVASASVPEVRPTSSVSRSRP